MDIRLAQLRFQQRLQNHLEYDADVRTIDIEYFLHKGQELYIDRTYEKYKGEESLRKRLAGVYKEELLNRTTYHEGDGVRTNSEIWKLIPGVRYVMDEFVRISTTDIPVKPVDASYFNKQSKNPYKKPYGNLVWRIDRGDYVDGGNVVLLHELVKSNSTNIDSYGIVYVKTPEAVQLTNDVVEFEVSSEYHDEIIDLAVEFALGIYSTTGRIKSDNEMKKL